MKPWGPQLEEVLGRKNYSQVPLGLYKSLQAGANGVKVVGSASWQPPVAALSLTLILAGKPGLMQHKWQASIVQLDI